MLSMAEFGKGILRNNQFNDMALFDDHQDEFSNKSCWVIMESNDHNNHHDEISSSDVSSSSSVSVSSISSDLTDDASSTSSSPHSNGPLYELSELMTQLPIKRGLSKYFQGKSQSFTSLSKVMSVEELAKKENPFNARRRMKTCKSFAANLDAHKFSYTISKKPPRSSSLSFSPRRKMNQIPPTNSMLNNF